MIRKSRRAERLRRWFFPPEVELPEHVRQLLRTVYPTLDLEELRFHLGIPHVFNLFAVQAITMPGKLRPRRARIYIEPNYWDPDSVDGLGLLLHEAYHALQIQEAGFGLGLLRPFMVLYLACAAGNGFRYAGHPMEDDAYRLAGDMDSLFESTFRNRTADVIPEACEPLATPRTGLGFWRLLAESTPGWRRAGESLRILMIPWVALWLVLWTLIVAILAVAKGAVEILGALAVGGLSVLVNLWKTGAERAPMSPTIVREGPFRLYFFSREEPRMHVHVAHSDGEAKFWLTPKVELANHVGLSARQLGEAERVVNLYFQEICDAWNKHFGGGSH